MNACLHCGTLSPGMFCCTGCKWVYQYLRSQNLDKYYSLKENESGGVPVGSSVVHPSLAEQIVPYTEGKDSLCFYLEGMHCAACVWLTEQLPRWVPEVESVESSLSDSSIRIKLKPPERSNERSSEKSNANHWQRVIEQLQRLGYRPRVVNENAEGLWLVSEKKEIRSLIMRLSVSGFCAGNIMISALGIYTGADSSYIRLFSSMTGVLYLPVYLYSFFPYLKSAWSSLRNRSISPDLPVVLGVTVGTVASYLSLFSGGQRFYFDSLSVLIFLLLGGQVLQKSLAKKARAKMQGAMQGVPQYLRKIDAHFKELTSIESLRSEWVSIASLIQGIKNQVNQNKIDSPSQPAGQPILILVKPGETIPFDGVAENRCVISKAFLTGESKAISVEKGGSVPSGAILEGKNSLVMSLKVSCEEPYLHSQIEKFSAEVQEKFRYVNTGSRRMLEQVARAFTWASICGGIALLIWAWIESSGRGGVRSEQGSVLGAGIGAGVEIEEWVYRAIALSLVSCPCAFLFGNPLAQVKAAAVAAARGVWVQSADFFERLARARIIAFDKTGTITTGIAEVRKISVWGGTSGNDSQLGSLSSVQPETLRRIISLQEQSEHPIGRALVEYLKGEQRGDSFDANTKVVDLHWENVELKTQKVTFDKSKIPNAKIPESLEAIGWFGKLKENNEKTLDSKSFEKVVSVGFFRMKSNPSISSEDLESPYYYVETASSDFLNVTPTIEVLFSEGIRSETAEIMKELEKKKKSLLVLSGDQKYNVKKTVESIASIGGLQGQIRWWGELTPSQKADQIAQLKHEGAILMIGDGLNDQEGFRMATVSIAVRGGVENGLQSADAVYLKSGIGFLPELFEIAKTARGVTFFQLGFTLFYNFSAMTLAVFGYLSPLAASLFMPLSAVIIFLQTNYAFGKFNARSKVSKYKEEILQLSESFIK